MALITTVGSTNANSYATLVEADIYLQLRLQSLDVSTWSTLSTDEKEFRMIMAATLLDGMRFRGIRACKTQALAFPRILPGGALWPLDDNGSITDALDYRYEDWDEVIERASDLGVALPGIPEEVKRAQVEIAFQVVQHALSLSPSEDSLDYVKWIQMGGDLALTFQRKTDLERGPYEAFGRDLISAEATIHFLLKRYLAPIRARTV